MKRLTVAVCGVLAGATVGPLLGACGGYFECSVIDHPLNSGRYVMPGRTDYSLLLEPDGGAVETYMEGVDAVRAEYAMGPAVAAH